MEGLVDSLMEEMNCNVAFTIPIFGGIDVLESVAVTWIVMAVIMIVSLILVQGLKFRKIRGKQAALESGISFLYDFFEDLLGKDGRAYIPYLITVIIYIGFSNMVGLFGFKPPTKDMNVTVTLAVMSIILVEIAGVRKKGVKKWLKSFAEPVPIVTPINILELFIRPLSLCMRLFGNILGAVVVMALIKYLLPVLVPLPFSFYFDIFDGIIQAYVFVFLTSLYIKEAIE
ncbi:MAG TPA: F0F1 ATP synthase subunit A [Candidatus Lachnoclostridium stercoravium]|uniref:ATP synthase subunit a n=1 Tax=Candidatus Lachnoclostridium stercoravium TaxID=2838633 RepID=A0A9D2HJV5_9FIRM|nr:F0F1 ATP synthase subunit A [Candidatus Lachnoclostridium stercoravium]